MATPPPRFDDGAAYERFMGGWSREAGAIFLDWLSPAPGLAWADIGCGNGVFTGLVCQRARPARVEAIDVSEGQLAFARTRPEAACATFRQGDAMALPYPDAAFDIAVMTLVIVFLPDPARGVAEMRRIVRPGATVATYIWDVAAGGFPAQPVWAALALLGAPQPVPPQAGAAGVEALEALWRGAGLLDIRQRAISITRRFADFETYWQACQDSTSIRAALAALAPAEAAKARAHAQSLVQTLPDGSVAVDAHANAIRGRVG